MEERIILRIVASGRVQGVGFRATVWKRAKQLGLLGTVRNRPDGSVEIFALGEKKKIDELMTSLKQNSGGAKVCSMEIEEVSPSEQFNDFLIL